jgi:type IV pilus assembly protein PilN
MPRINLLPWRDEERKERKLKFLVALGGAAVGACLTAFCGYLLMDSMISAQEARNAVLDEKIAELGDRAVFQRRLGARPDVRRR